MSKIVFFCIPAHGHTNPTLGVVKELVSRGHHVTYYSYETFREKIEAAGAQFVPCDPYDREQKLTTKEIVKLGKDLAFSTEVLVDTTLALDDVVCAHMKELRPDCIVADSMAVWGKAVALKLGIPMVSSTTTFAFNEHSAKIMKQGFMDILKMILSLPKINKNVKRLQAAGYPIKSILDIIQNDNETHTIVYTSPEFQPCSETFSDKYVFVGPSIRPPQSTVEKTAEKLIYISMGTVNNDLLPFYRNCIKAFADTSYQFIMSIGNWTDMDALGPIPGNFTVASYVDQMAVLEKADAFITHCGMNSTSEGLYFQTPLVMFPQQAEQGGVASRVEELGAGIRLQFAGPDAIKEAVEKVLAGPSYKEAAIKISDSFKRCSGVKGAADKIESLCKK